MNSVLQLNTAFSIGFNERAFFSSLFQSRIPIKLCVVQDTGSNIGRIFEYYGSPTANPANIIALANANSFNQLSAAIAALNAYPIQALNVIMINNIVTERNGNLNFPPNTVITGYYDFNTGVQLSTIQIRNGFFTWQFNSCVCVSISINGRVTFRSNSNLSICQCVWNFVDQIFDLVVNPAVRNYIQYSGISGQSPLFRLLNTSNETGFLNIIGSDIRVNRGESLYTLPFGSNVTINIINSRINSRYMIERVGVSENFEYTPSTDINVYWYNNILDKQDKDNYLLLPYEPLELANNNLISATLLNDTHIDMRKFKKILAYNSQADMIVKQ